MRRAVTALAALALVGALVLGISQSGGGTDATSDPRPFDLAEAQRRLAGAPAPLAALHRRSADLEEGADVERFEELRAELKGYPIVVNAWATWCAPCKLEFPIFQRVATELGKRVAFVGLNVNDSARKAREFLAQRPVPYPSLEDGNARIAQHVGWVGGLPITVFYDRSGKKFVRQGVYAKDADLIADIRRYAGA